MSKRRFYSYAGTSFCSTKLLFLLLLLLAATVTEGILAVLTRLRAQL